MKLQISIIIVLIVSQVTALPIILPLLTLVPLVSLPERQLSPQSGHHQNNTELLNEAILQSFEDESNTIIGLINNTIENSYEDSTKPERVVEKPTNLFNQIVNDIIESSLLLKFFSGLLFNQSKTNLETLLDEEIQSTTNISFIAKTQNNSSTNLNSTSGIISDYPIPNGPKLDSNASVLLSSTNSTLISNAQTVRSTPLNSLIVNSTVLTSSSVNITDLNTGFINSDITKNSSTVNPNSITGQPIIALNITNQNGVTT